MTRTVADVQAELDTINAALQELIAGTRLTRLQVGSGEFTRVYDHQEISYDTLKAERDSLTAELATLNSTSGLSFRKGYSIPLVVSKMPRGF